MRGKEASKEPEQAPEEDETSSFRSTDDDEEVLDEFLKNMEPWDWLHGGNWASMCMI